MNKSDWVFLKESIKQPLVSGTIIACRPKLLDAFLEKTHIKEKKLVVELGAGTGAITGKLIKSLPTKSRLLVFEINEKMAEHIATKHKDKRVSVINDSAENIPKHIQMFGLPKADLIISTLPLSTLKRKTQVAIVKAVKESLSDNGEYLQFQYFPTKTALLKKHFPVTKLSFTSKNIPPGFIYKCLVRKS